MMLMLKGKLYKIMQSDPGARYSLQYVDYSETQWTIPARLTQERIEKFGNDLSLHCVSVIYSNGETDYFRVEDFLEYE